MEQKKTLWIIAAVGTFLLVVLGTAGILYSPSKNSDTEIVQVATSTKDKSKNNNGWKSETHDSGSDKPVAIENNSNTLTPQLVDEMVVVSNNTTIYDINKGKDDEDEGTTIDLNALKSEIKTPEEKTDVKEPAPLQPQININVTVPESVNKVVKAPDFSSKVSAPETKPEVQAKKKAPTQEKTKTQSGRKSNPAPVQKAAPKKITQYWVQVASYSNKKGAENAKSILDDNKISSDIFTFEDKKDDLFYRVRIGPYTTKSEAEYWKARVLKIDYFKNNDSYITSTIK